MAKINYGSNKINNILGANQIQDSDHETDSQMILTRIFLDHPRTVNESYIQHGIFAMTISFKLFVASLAASIHALIPCLCKTTASKIILGLAYRVENRGK